MTTPSTTLPLSPDELLTTTRTVRKRLDFDRPVPRQLIEECIDIALQAPTGSVKQNWQWIAVSDPDTKQALAEIYRDSYRHSAGGRVRTTLDYPPGDARSVRLAKVLESSEYLVENMARVPWLVIAAGTGRVLGNPTVPEQSRFWGSVLPAMWSFMLAARARGLGCAWTTEHLKQEEKVADLLGIPFPEVTQCGMFPVAYSIGTEFRPAARIPAAEVTHWDRW
jgi:nitroreductase